MQLSMWILMDWFEKYHIQHKIKKGSATITGVRLLFGDLAKYPRSYVYVSLASTIFGDNAYKDKSILVNEHDFIILDEPDTEVVLNEVLAAFEHYNKWESSLLAAVQKENPLQQIINLSDPVIKKPSRIMNQYGNVLAISQSFDPDKMGSPWKQICQTRMVQLSNVGTPVITSSGDILPEWTSYPQEYITEGDLRPYIASNIVVDNENVAVFIMHQYETPFTPAHCQLATVLCDVLKLVATKSEQNLLKSNSALLLRLLDGTLADEETPDKLNSFEGTPPLDAHQYE